MYILPQDNDLYLEKAQVPEGVGVAAASKGQRKLTKAPRTPRKKHEMISNPTNKKEIVSGQPRGRPYSA